MSSQDFKVVECYQQIPNYNS